jgi:WD40 repeat protein
MASKLSCIPLLFFSAVWTLSAPSQTPPPEKPATPRLDQYGDPLPPGVLARCGSNRLRFSDKVCFLAFSPDSKTLVAGRSGAIALWDSDTGKLRHFIPLRAGYRPLHAVFSPDSRFLTCVCSWIEAECVSVDVEQGQLIQRVVLEKDGGPAAIVSAQIAPDGSQVAVGKLDDTIRLHDTTTGQEVARLTVPVTKRTVWQFCFSPDGQTVAVCAGQGKVHFCQLATGQWTTGLEVTGAVFARGIFSPSGRRFAVCSSHNSWDKSKARVPNLIVWDWATRKPLFQETTTGPSHVHQMVLSANDKLLVHDLPNRPAVVRDAATGKVVTQLGTSYEEDCYAFSPNGQRFAAAHRNRVYLWDMGTWQNRSAQTDPLEGAAHLQFSTDSQRLHGWGNIPLTWEAATGKLLQRQSTPPSWIAGSLSLSPDESLMACGGFEQITLWNPSTGKIVHTWKGLKGAVSYTQFTADGRKLAASTSEDGFLLYNLATKQMEQRLPIARCHLFALSPNQQWLASGEWRGSSVLEIWNLRTGKLARSLRLQPTIAVVLAFSPDNRYLVLGGITDSGPSPKASGIIQFWDISQGTVVHSCVGSMDGVCALAFSADGRMLLSGDWGKRVRLWEVASGQARAIWTGHTSVITAVAFSPDNRLAASASVEAPVYLWPVRNHLASTPLTTASLEQAFVDLRSADALRAFQSVQRLAASPGTAVPFLEKRLSPVSPLPAERVRRLLQELDDPAFVTREKALVGLKNLGELALPEVRQAQQQARSVDLRRRLDDLYQHLTGAYPEKLCQVRAVEALEWMATPEAVKLLEHLATGAPEATLTKEAQAAVKRLRR